MTLLLVMIGGGLGSGARYLVGRWAIGVLGTAFPYGTVIVNLAGCFVLGLVVQMSSAGNWHPDVRAAIATGFIGGFTTYSTFNQDTIGLFTSGATGAAVLNVAITLAGGLAAGSLGLAAARMFQS